MSTDKSWLSQDTIHMSAVRIPAAQVSVLDVSSIVSFVTNDARIVGIRSIDNDTIVASVDYLGMRLRAAFKRSESGWELAEVGRYP